MTSVTPSETQPKFGWVFSFGLVSLVVLSGFALLDESLLAGRILAVLIALFPIKVDLSRRLILIAVGSILWMFGSASCIVVAPATLLIIGYKFEAVLAFLLLLSVALVEPLQQNISNHIIFGVQAASLLFLVVPILCAVVILFNVLTRSGVLRLLVWMFGSVLLVSIATKYWLDPAVFTSQPFRLLAVASPVFALSLFGNRVREPSGLILGWQAVAGFLLGALIAFVPSATQINTIIFDESHGKWETVNASFGPDNFGRAVNYTYSKLYDKTKKIVGKVDTYDNELNDLPSPTDGMFVLKMPSVPLSQEFISKLTNWVRDGGRLLVVADHTDLYDTTQNLNSLLGEEFGIFIKSDAVSDREGMPNLPKAGFGAAIIGRIDATSTEFPWQTGSSLTRYPIGGVQLSTYGLGFSEDANYARANRFGTFEPNLKNRYLSHTSVLGKAVGNGAVVLMLDSTPWSNFSIFKAQYLKIYRSIIAVLEHKGQLKIFGYSWLLLLVVIPFFILVRNKLTIFIASTALGITIGAGMILGFASFIKPVSGKEYSVIAVLGKDAKTEILRQLVYPGESNYSRILSSMGKYDLDVMAVPKGQSLPKLHESDRWLFIEPTVDLLPSREQLVDHISSGKSITILFSARQSTDAGIRGWLNSLGMQTSRRIGLSVADFQNTSRGSLLGGRSAALERSVVVVTDARASSIFKGYENDNYFQSYTIRPTTIPRTSGLLNIGFMSDQFSDDVLGDVWEGTQYSSIGKQRERQLATILADGERAALMPSWIKRVDSVETNALPEFVVAENGKSILSGTITKSTRSDPTIEYFANLRNQSVEFVRRYCPQGEAQTTCETRMLATDMIEWIVTWKGIKKGKPDAIELIHERGMSGLGSTWNVVFGK